MQKVAIGETSDTSTRQHLLAALQKLSLRLKKKMIFQEKINEEFEYFRRSVQMIMINQNMIKWLVPLLSQTNQISDYTLGKL